MIPKTIINGKGEFVGVDQTERVQELLSDMYAPLANSPEASSGPSFKEFAQRMTASDALSKLGRSEWVSTVGKWVGSNLDPRPIEGPGSMYLAPNEYAPTAIYQQMTDRAPCRRADVAAECVTFEIRETLAPEGPRRNDG